MTCPVCSGLTPIELDSIRSSFMSGNEPEKIAMSYDISFEEMRSHCEICIKIEKTRFERLCSLIEDLSDNVETARDTYASSPDNPDLARAYATLARELRSTIESAQNLVKPEQQVTELADLLIKPMITDTIRCLTDEVRKLRDELIQHGYDNEIVMGICNARLTAMGSHLKRIMTLSLVELNTYYGTDVVTSIQVAKANLNS